MFPLAAEFHLRNVYITLWGSQVPILVEHRIDSQGVYELATAWVRSEYASQHHSALLRISVVDNEPEPARDRPGLFGVDTPQARFGLDWLPPPPLPGPPAPLPPLAIPHRAAADDVEGEEGAHGHAPPPYRVPGMGMEMDLDLGHEDHEDHGRVVHPPPYMDLVHDSQR